MSKATLFVLRKPNCQPCTTQFQLYEQVAPQLHTRGRAIIYSSSFTMPQGTSQAFRFFDLPGELRNEVYKILLCSFEEPESSSDDEVKLRFCYLTSAIETAILRTSKKVYREAYDVMIKTNKFIVVKAEGMNMLAYLLASTKFPILKCTPKHIAEFNGAALSVRMVYDRSIMTTGLKKRVITYRSFMFPSSGLMRFCEALSQSDVILDPDFPRSVEISVTVGPGLSKASKGMGFADFLLVNEDTLLSSFRQYLRGFRSVRADGLVTPKYLVPVQGEAVSPG